MTPFHDIGIPFLFGGFPAGDCTIPDDLSAGKGARGLWENARRYVIIPCGIQSGSYSTKENGMEKKPSGREIRLTTLSSCAG
jgi:hypothetical protein